MAHSYDHLREKAIQLRTHHRMTLDEIVERLALPKTTVYHWIKDVPIPRTSKKVRTPAQIKGTEAMKAKYTAKREEAYRQGMAEAPELFKAATFRDFVVLYIGEGTKKKRNSVEFVNSDARMVKLAHSWIHRLTTNKQGITYRLQCHVDHDENELKAYWSSMVDVPPEKFKIMRKSNSNQLAGRQFRSKYGLLTVRVGDTYLRARMQAWMDFIKAQW